MNWFGDVQFNFQDVDNDNLISPLKMDLGQKLSIRKINPVTASFERENRDADIPKLRINDERIIEKFKKKKGGEKWFRIITDLPNGDLIPNKLKVVFINLGEYLESKNKSFDIVQPEISKLSKTLFFLIKDNSTAFFDTPEGQDKLINNLNNAYGEASRKAGINAWVLKGAKTSKIKYKNETEYISGFGLVNDYLFGSKSIEPKNYHRLSNEIKEQFKDVINWRLGDIFDDDLILKKKEIEETIKDIINLDELKEELTETETSDSDLEKLEKLEKLKNIFKNITLTELKKILFIFTLFPPPLIITLIILLIILNKKNKKK